MGSGYGQAPGKPVPYEAMLPCVPSAPESVWPPQQNRFLPPEIRLGTPEPDWRKVSEASPGGVGDTLEGRNFGKRSGGSLSARSQLQDLRGIRGPPNMGR